MNILAIDTSTKTLSIAIQRENIIVGELTVNSERTHTPRLLPAIHQLMKKVEITPDQLNKIVVGKGPGSYTGVRIGVTTAKSLSWALNIPIIGVSSLEALAYQGYFFSSYICPFFDARRMNVFTGLYQIKNGEAENVIEETNISMEDWLKEINKYDRRILFLSPHLKIYQNLIDQFCQEKAMIPEEAYHHIRPAHLISASKSYDSDELHTLTPNYLRLAEAEANWLKSQEEKKR